MTQGYELYACPGCRLEFLNPQPDDSTLSSIYGNEYFLGDHTEESSARRSQLKRASAKWFLDMLASQAMTPGTALLEIGCGQGELLMEARDRGFQVSGVELSAHATAIANQRLGQNVVQQGSIDSLPLPPEHFGAILAADVIEHVRDPQSFMFRIRELLSPGGIALLVTPSLDSWSRRVMRRHWMEYKIEHLFYFSPASMRQLLEQSGFDGIRIFPNRKAMTIDYLWRHFDRYRVALLSPLIGLLRRVVPEPLAHRHLHVPASGLVAIARRSSK